MYDLIPTEGVFFVGNGSVAMGGEGADIIQLFAPCYSLPSVITLRMTSPTLQAQNHRIRGSAGYVTTLTDTETHTSIGKITDYTHPTLPVYVRRFCLNQPVTFALESPFHMVNTDRLYAGNAWARLIEIPEGTPIFSKSKTDKETYCQLILSPNCDTKEGSITVPAGRSHLIFVGGAYGELGTASFENCMMLSETMISADLDGMMTDFLDHWKNRFDEICVNRQALATIPDGDELVESVAAALMTQTSVQGGVLAGAFYHLAYGRDMYGVFRGYMALGLHDCARNMVAYMADIYREKGYMPNASGMGMSASHRHENDNVEQTGYYLLELLDYAETTGDMDFLRDRMDYARFLLNAQEKQLVNRMIPFNGDETYIAGGIFPRGGIDHGSMEATALYIGSALRLLDTCAANGLMDPEEIGAHRGVALSARSAFTENFMDGEQVYVNNPHRIPITDTPAYRHGVCHRCLGMTNLLRAPEGGYLCPSCYGQAPAPVSTDRYSTDCALWMSVFAGCSLLPTEVVQSALARTIEQVRKSRYGENNPENTVGYEYGVILYALAHTYPPDALPAYRDLLTALLDDRVKGSVWTEYYRGGKPNQASCPYRPWESAINLCGILAYLNSTY